MTPVYIIGQNAEYPPSYEVLEVQHPEDHEVWNFIHKELFTPAEISDQDKIETLLKNSRLTNLHAFSFNASTFNKSTVNLCRESDHVRNAKELYNVIRSAIKTSYTLSIRIMPNFNDLKPNIPIKRMMEPASKNYNNESAIFLQPNDL